MSIVTFGKVEQQVKVIAELVEQGECFYMNSKFEQLQEEIKTLQLLTLTKYLDDAEETK